MKNGTIKVYNTEKKYGYITKSNGEDIFFHLNNVTDELLVLLEYNKGVGEPVLFEDIPSTRKQGVLEAVSVKLNLSLRKVGLITVEERTIGTVYFVKDYYSDDMYFLHHSNVRKGTLDKFINLEDSSPALFSPKQNEKGLIAEDVVLIDNRQFIQSFASFLNFDNALKELQTISEDENWDYILNKKNGNPILRSYINQTCKRIVQQGKVIVEKSGQGETYAVFNTGLVDKFQSDIFAFFKLNNRYKDNQPWGVKIPKWWFLEFNTDQSVYYKYFGRMPEIATYFDEADTSKLIFDTSLTIRSNWEHLKDRKHRISSEEIQKMSEQEFRDAIEDSIMMAKKRIRRNYKTAIPHFYNGDIQFLVPLCERKNRGRALAAMVVQKKEKIYEVTTILTLDQAYNNARLLAKPDREWLNP